MECKENYVKKSIFQNKLIIQNVENLLSSFIENVQNLFSKF